MSPLRWAATIVGFPLGGLAAITVASTTAGPAAAALAGLIAGAILGLGQWLALRPHVSVWWIAATSVGLAVGGAVATAVTSAGSDLGSLALFGAISGAAVGLAQGIVLGTNRLLVWAPTVSIAWAAAWLITTLVIVDEQRGYIVFGLSGAALATIVTGLVLRLLLGARPARDRGAEVTA
jgi:hypothetical protein